MIARWMPNHPNFPTVVMRTPGRGLDAIRPAVTPPETVPARHVVNDGFGIADRLTGRHEAWTGTYRSDA